MSINNIKLIDINKNLQKKVILNNINLEFNKGKIVGIIGANGSGKSSLFKVLSGLWNFDSGKILFDEIEITENKNFIRKNIGAFIENPNFYEDLNALQNFEIIKKLYNIRNEEWYYKLISDFGIDKFINIKLKKCSLGMRQKVAIVMALLPNPDIIILDEATNSLDISAVNVLHKLLMTLKNEKIIIVSSHILEEIDSLCDDIYMLDKGKVISKTNHESNRVYVIRFKHSNQNIDLLKSGRIITQINDFTFKMECNNLNELFIECNNLKLEVASIRNESSTKLLFNGEVES
ncbi:ABC transporter ATP-binding protein [uncultured Clostridium sp.]|uniref:ABC transporter ATP-binding protein n=1 Tax=Clostridium sp. TaxID=1506 RepID=UPI0025FEB100|nr:ABC transporter ATP-binding protein [uncultured Clostridium sp.]